jgi:hypothetical protein
MASRKKIIILVIFIIFLAAFLVVRNYEFKPVAMTGSAALSWKANTEADFAGYKIYYGTKPRNGDCPPGGYEKNTDVKNVTNYRLNNLASGKTYYFSVTSYNTVGKESCFSEEIKKAIPVSITDRILNIFRRK